VDFFWCKDDQTSEAHDVRSELIVQTKNAFDFLSKLYFETSYFIKEIEGLLQKEEEEFVIGRPSGYGVTTTTSVGLEPMNVDYWFPKTFTVFFCPKAITELKGGVTITRFSEKLKAILIHIILTEKGLKEPIVISGCIRNILCKKRDKFTKFENVMYEFAYYSSKIFSTFPDVKFQDGVWSFEGKFIKRPLYSINSSHDVKREVIDPVLELYRSE